MCAHGLEQRWPILGGGLVMKRRARQRRIKMEIGHFEVRRHCPQVRLDLDGCVDCAARFARENASLQLADPVPADGHAHAWVIVQPTFEFLLVESRPVERGHARCLAPQCEDEAKLTLHDVDNESEAKLAGELELTFGLPLHAVKWLASREERGDQVATAVRGEGEV